MGLWPIFMYLHPRALPQRSALYTLSLCPAQPGPASVPLWGGAQREPGAPHLPSLHGVGSPVADLTGPPSLPPQPRAPWGQAVTQGSGPSVDMGWGPLT